MICTKCKNRIFDHVCVEMCDEKVCPNKQANEFKPVKRNKLKRVKGLSINPVGFFKSLKSV